ncbi:MAG: DUF4358 domain-containing protein [Massiliimalia sp.]|jgi:hypothetical protein
MKALKKIAVLLMTVLCVGIFVSCGQEKNTTPDVSLDTIHQAVKDAYGENYLPSMEFTQEEIEEKFGITSDMAEEVFAEGPMISAHVDTLIGVKAKEGQAEAVEQALNDYRTKMIEEGMTYPMNLPKQEASQVLREGDYVFFVMLGAYAEDEDVLSSEEKTKEFYEEQTQIGIDAIETALGK